MNVEGRVVYGEPFDRVILSVEGQGVVVRGYEGVHVHVGHATDRHPLLDAFVEFVQAFEMIRSGVEENSAG